jgi:hypothetical protein
MVDRECCKIDDHRFLKCIFFVLKTFAFCNCFEDDCDIQGGPAFGCHIRSREQHKRRLKVLFILLQSNLPLRMSFGLVR